MKSFSVSDPKSYINLLFTDERFDSFYLYEVRFKTEVDVYISGKRNMAYDESVTDEQKEDPAYTYVTWGSIKKKVLLMMRGERLPLSMKLVLMFSRENINRLVEMKNLPVRADEISGLFLNVTLEGEQLVLTSGTSLSVFTMDKTVEQLWDETLERYYME